MGADEELERRGASKLIFLALALKIRTYCELQVENYEEEFPDHRLWARLNNLMAWESGSTSTFAEI